MGLKPNTALLRAWVDPNKPRSNKAMALMFPVEALLLWLYHQQEVQDHKTCVWYREENRSLREQESWVSHAYAGKPLL